MEDAKGKIAHQFDAVALEYDFMAEIFHSTNLFLENLPRGRELALELGCGSGLLANELAKHFNGVIGIDVSMDLLRIAQAKRKQDNVLYSQMDVSHLGVSPRFDYITSQHVFHHLDDIPKVLEQLKQLLKPGGRLILTDVISERETPPTYVYIVGAFQEYIPNVLKYDRKTANRIFQFRISRHWLSHLASDRYLSKDTFRQLYSSHLPGCIFPNAACVVWDKPSNS
jgi:ubiquinone/menaquinone biosynthesis C-methylase UbiE